MRLSVTKRFKFSAAHHLPEDPGPCQRVHGHTFQLDVTARGERDRAGMVIHFDRLKAAFAIVERKLDHQDLNRSLPVQAQPPTTENVAAWLVEELHSLEPLVVEVRLWEGPTSYVVASVE